VLLLMRGLKMNLLLLLLEKDRIFVGIVCLELWRIRLLLNMVLLWEDELLYLLGHLF